MCVAVRELEIQVLERVCVGGGAFSATYATSCCDGNAIKVLKSSRPPSIFHVYGEDTAVKLTEKDPQRPVGLLMTRQPQMNNFLIQNARPKAAALNFLSLVITAFVLERTLIRPQSAAQHADFVYLKI
jgi:hypothetical protein